MALALTVFGTPDGFDFEATGDTELATSEVVSKFDGLGFSSIDLPLGSIVWGVFRRTTTAGVVLGVGVFTRAIEASLSRPGGYIGVGVVLKDTVVTSSAIHSALTEFRDAAVGAALNAPNYKFLASRIALLPKIPVPASCKELHARQRDGLKASPYASKSIVGNYIDASEDIVEALSLLITNQQYVVDYSVLISDDPNVISRLRKAKGEPVNLDGLANWFLGVKAEIQAKEKNAARERELAAARERELAAARERELAAARERETRGAKDRESRDLLYLAGPAAHAATPQSSQTAFGQLPGEPGQYAKGFAEGRAREIGIAEDKIDKLTEDFAHARSTLITLGVTGGVLAAILSGTISYFAAREPGLQEKNKSLLSNMADLEDENRAQLVELESLRSRLKPLPKVAEPTTAETEPVKTAVEPAKAGPAAAATSAAPAKKNACKDKGNTSSAKDCLRTALDSQSAKPNQQTIGKGGILVVPVTGRDTGGNTREILKPSVSSDAAIAGPVVGPALKVTVPGKDPQAPRTPIPERSEADVP